MTANTAGNRLELVSPDALREHEQVDQEVLERTLQEIASEGVVRRPIVADSRTLVVLDGTHRLNALRRLGCTLVPVYLVDYQSAEITVSTTRRGMSVSKDDVVEAARSGRKFPAKTTYHMVEAGDGRLRHISWIEDQVDVPLASLLGEPRRHAAADTPRDTGVVCEYCGKEFRSEEEDAHLFSEHGIAI